MKFWELCRPQLDVGSATYKYWAFGTCLFLYPLQILLKWREGPICTLDISIGFSLNISTGLSHTTYLQRILSYNDFGIGHLHLITLLQRIISHDPSVISQHSDSKERSIAERKQETLSSSHSPPFPPQLFKRNPFLERRMKSSYFGCRQITEYCTVHFMEVSAVLEFQEKLLC